MANEQNLIPFDERTESEKRRIGTMGGQASGEARRRKRDIRLAMEALLEKSYKVSGGEKDGTEMSGAEAIALKQMEKALKGDAKAFELVRDTAGQKPVEVVEQVNVDAQYQEKMEMLKKYFGDESDTDNREDKK